MRSDRSFAGINIWGNCLMSPWTALSSALATGTSSWSGWPCHKPYSRRKKPLEIGVVHPTDEAEGTAVDLVVEVPKRVIGGAKASVVEVGRQPQLARPGQVAVIDSGLQVRRWPPRDAPSRWRGSSGM